MQNKDDANNTDNGTNKSYHSLAMRCCEECGGTFSAMGKAISTAVTEQQDSTGEHKGRPATVQVHNVYDLRSFQEVVLRILRA